MVQRLHHNLILKDLSRKMVFLTGSRQTAIQLIKNLRLERVENGIEIRKAHQYLRNLEMWRVV